MRVAIISDAVYPTPWEFGHGLGRSAYDMGVGLLERGHEVVLFGCHGSKLDGATVITVPQEADGRRETNLAAAVFNNLKHFEVAIDMSHTHTMGSRQAVPTITCFQDRAGYHGKNMVFPSQYVKSYVNKPGKVIVNGLKIGDYCLYEGERDSYLLFLGSDIGHKGVRSARAVAGDLGMALHEFGSGCRDGVVSGARKLAELQRAKAVLCPYQIDAGPHVPLEAMACGTPVVALRLAAMPEYVPAGGGILVDTESEMAEAVRAVGEFEPRSVARVVEPFDIDIRVSKYETMLRQILGGVTW